MTRSVILTLGILIIVTAVIFSGYSVYAQNPLIFGGFVTNSFYCNCSNTFLLTLSPPTPGQWVWVPGTPQFANFQLPRAGVWALGNYSPGAICTIFVGKGCAPFGAPIGTIGPLTGTSF